MARRPPSFPDRVRNVAILPELTIVEFAGGGVVDRRTTRWHCQEKWFERRIAVRPTSRCRHVVLDVATRARVDRRCPDCVPPSRLESPNG